MLWLRAHVSCSLQPAFHCNPHSPNTAACDVWATAASRRVLQGSRPVLLASHSNVRIFCKQHPKSIMNCMVGGFLSFLRASAGQLALPAVALCMRARGVAETPRPAILHLLRNSEAHMRRTARFLMFAASHIRKALHSEMPPASHARQNLCSAMRCRSTRAACEQHCVLQCSL